MHRLSAAGFGQRALGHDAGAACAGGNRKIPRPGPDRRIPARVTLPLAAPGMGAAAALVFISVTTELTATLLLAPIGTQTLATQVWADTSTLAFAAAAPYAAVMAAISMAASWLLARRFGAASIYAPVTVV
jgi:ABC-type maltose transport system permease subunit